MCGVKERQRLPSANKVSQKTQGKKCYWDFGNPVFLPWLSAWEWMVRAKRLPELHIRDYTQFYLCISFDQHLWDCHGKCVDPGRYRWQNLTNKFSPSSADKCLVRQVTYERPEEQFHPRSASRTRRCFWGHSQDCKWELTTGTQGTQKQPHRWAVSPAWVLTTTTPSCSMESSLQSYAAASPKSILSWEEGVVPRILDKFWQINLFLCLQLVLTAHYVCCASFCRSVSCFRAKVMGLRISIAISASWWRQPCYARRKSHPLAYV